MQLAKHPDKTYIGRIEKGFDFLGYHFWPGKLGVAKKTIENFMTRINQLYEQKREKPKGDSTLSEYVRRWVRWVRAGLEKYICHFFPRRSWAHGAPGGLASAVLSACSFVFVC